MSTDKDGTQVCDWTAEYSGEADASKCCDYPEHAELEQSLVHERQQREAAEGYAKSEGDALRLLDKGNAALRAQLEAAEAERDRYKVFHEEQMLTPHTSQWFARQRDEAKALTAKLLALAVEQRRALEDIANGDAERWEWDDVGTGHCDSMGCYKMAAAGDDMMKVATTAMTTDLDALVNEARSLGIDGKIEEQEKTEA